MFQIRMNLLLVFLIVAVSGDITIYSTPSLTKIPYNPSVTSEPNESTIVKTDLPSTNFIQRSTQAVDPAKSSVLPTNSSVVPAISSVLPTNSSVVPAISSVVPTNSSAVPAISSVVPTNSSAIPAISSVVPTNSSAVPAITSYAPTNSSMAPPKTSAVPTTPPTTTPTPSKGVDVAVKDPKTNRTGLWFRATIVINVEFLVNQTKKYHKIDVTQDVLHLPVQGACSNLSETDNSSSIILQLDPDYKNNYLVIKFTAMENKHWIFEEVAVHLNLRSFSAGLGAVDGVVASKTFDDHTNAEYFRGEAGHAYKCDTERSLPLNSANSTLYNVTVDFKKVFVQPFENKGVATKDINTCPSGEKSPKSSSIVPIAVGCALAGLIVIVLIAYLIGRRKSDSRGYQQV